MDLDLNQEPLEPPHGSMLGLGSLLNDIETAHGRIEERIRQLEAVTSRARQRQRWRQGQTAQTVLVADSHSEGTIDSQERTVENSKTSKRNRSLLIAKALEMDTEVKKARSDGGGFFDCNICLEPARDPILTCCGHLFCWPCFYKVPYIQSNVKECPVCKGEVTDITITPIYVGSKTHKSEVEESGFGDPS
ncbi:hypothetical protein L1049_012265 [Liquidambar formosana]|uniref:E3 ubiquitin-protein ligase RMA n=1 Tax=Liquidambar formosana TaxID=63359 RepID=A0AAP0X0E2_LIQFO